MGSQCIEFFAKFGDVNKAQSVFESIRSSEYEIDAIAVSAMMSAYIESEQYEQALSLYDEYDAINDDVSHVLALKASVYSKDCERGKCLIQKHTIQSAENEKYKKET